MLALLINSIIGEISYQDMDLRNTVKNGVLHLQDPVDKKWNPHFFVLSRNKLFYTGCVNTSTDLDAEEECDDSETSSPSPSTNQREVSSIF